MAKNSTIGHNHTIISKSPLAKPTPESPKTGTKNPQQSTSPSYTEYNNPTNISTLPDLNSNHLPALLEIDVKTKHTENHRQRNIKDYNLNLFTNTLELKIDSTQLNTKDINAIEDMDNTIDTLTTNSHANYH